MPITACAKNDESKEVGASRRENIKQNILDQPNAAKRQKGKKEKKTSLNSRRPYAVLPEEAYAAISDAAGCPGGGIIPCTTRLFYYETSCDSSLVITKIRLIARDGYLHSNALCTFW